MKTYIVKSQHIFDNESVSLMVEPSEIVVGRNYSEEPKIMQISMSTATLNWMFSSSPLETSLGFSKEHPAVLNYTFPDAIKTTDMHRSYISGADDIEDAKSILNDSLEQRV